MAIRTFRSRTMAGALEAVRREMGSDAVVLHTRTVRAGGMLGLGAKDWTEITATTEEQRSPTTRSRGAETHPTRDDGETRRRELLRMAEEAGRRQTTPYASPAPPTQDRIRDVVDIAGPRGVAEIEPATPAALRGRSRESPTPDPSHTLPNTRQDGRNERASSIDETRLKLMEALAGRGIDVDAACEARVNTARGIAERVMAGRASNATDGARRDDPDASPADMQGELAALTKMVRQVLHAQRGATSAGMPDALAPAYQHLIDEGLCAELAAEIMHRVRENTDEASWADAASVRDAVVRELAGELPVLGSMRSGGRSEDGRPVTIALLGATGVGKTTTLAKIAASYKLRFGHRVGLIASDTYRIAAVDQLRAYANIIGLPFRIVGDAAEAEQACHALSDCDVILVDTAGRSQRDACKLGELGALLDAVRPHERHLVLPLTASAPVLSEAAARFRDLRPDRVILTKADEAVAMGGAMTVVRSLGVPVSFVTTGQEVPDEIELATAERLAGLVYGPGPT